MNKTQLKSKIRSILNSYQIGYTVDKQDFDLLMWLLQRHPQADLKIRQGIDYITVEREKKFGTRHFMLHRIDGSETDFSIGKCFNPPTSMQRFKSAARRVVAEDIIAFKNEQFEHSNGYLICPVTEKSISKSESHVDHVYPSTFNKLVNHFVQKYSIKPSCIRYIDSEKDGKIGTEFEDKDLSRKFRDFHKQNARLRILSGYGNLSIAKRLLTFSDMLL